ncbi:MAG: molybdenum cofactor guanylyltransferase [Pseudomonadota bacterium]
MPNRDPALKPDIACVILAGGQSRRFGSNKALARLDGKRLVDLMIQRLASQTTGPIAVSAPDDGALSLDQHQILPDLVGDDIGPLAGLHAAISWAAANGYEAVITTPVDTPGLPEDFVARLLAVSAPAVARCEHRVHGLHGIWPVSLISDLKAQISSGLRAARLWAEACGAQECVFTSSSVHDPFYNVNTQADLSKLIRL